MIAAARNFVLAALVAVAAVPTPAASALAQTRTNTTPQPAQAAAVAPARPAPQTSPGAVVLQLIQGLLTRAAETPPPKAARAQTTPAQPAPTAATPAPAPGKTAAAKPAPAKSAAAPRRMPLVRGLPVEAALRVLKANDLGPPTVSRIRAPQPRDLVVAQSPEPKTPLVGSPAVNLTLSLGPLPRAATPANAPSRHAASPGPKPSRSASASAAKAAAQAAADRARAEAAVRRTRLAWWAGSLLLLALIGGAGPWALTHLVAVRAGLAAPVAAAVKDPAASPAGPRIGLDWTLELGPATAALADRHAGASPALQPEEAPA